MLSVRFYRLRLSNICVCLNVGEIITLQKVGRLGELVSFYDKNMNQRFTHSAVCTNSFFCPVCKALCYIYIFIIRTLTGVQNDVLLSELIFNS